MSELQFKLEAYEGPLDLLLNLIAKNKVSIYDIPISLILEQYLIEIEKMKDFDPDITSDFIAMAAELVLIKSRLLLPKDVNEDELDPREKLVEMLLEYQKYKEISSVLLDKNTVGQDLFVKKPEVFEKNKEVEGKVDQLANALRDVLEHLKDKESPSPRVFEKLVGTEPYPVEDKISKILNKFIRQENLNVNTLFLEANSRTELVAVFLAILELCKIQKIFILGDGDDMVLSLSAEGEV